jgi:hypothetical protein
MACTAYRRGFNHVIVRTQVLVAIASDFALKGAKLKNVLKGAMLD